jgi:hypothetical protein
MAASAPAPSSSSPALLVLGAIVVFVGRAEE